nr:protein FLC EXPRESSOR-like isoform X1 [Ipomoea batatas]
MRVAVNWMVTTLNAPHWTLLEGDADDLRGRIAEERRQRTWEAGTLTAVASTVSKAECDAEVRGVYDNSIRAEVEICVIAKLARVKDDIEKIKVDREDLTAN